MRKNIVNTSIILTISILCFTMALCIMFASTNSVALAEEKVYSRASINEDFADDCLLVVMTNQVSLLEYEYTKNSFAEIDCIDIEEITVGDTMNEKYNRMFALKIGNPGKQNVLDAIKIIEQRNDVKGVSPDYYMQACSSIVEPNDTEYLTDKQWYLDKIQAQEAWAFVTGSSAVKVGVIDSGIQANHSDLINRVNTSLSATILNASGQVYSNPSPLTDTYDLYGHGTAVAGIIGAQSNNGSGISGICWNVDIVSQRIISAENEVDLRSITQQIEYARINNIPIVNLSYACGMVSDIIGMTTAVQNYPGLIVCSAGNGTNMDYTDDGIDIDVRNIDMNEANGDENVQVYYYPQCLSYLDNVITVGAANSDDTRRTDSNYGENNVTVFAPGTNIYTTINTGGYTNVGGTSFAAPIVAGIAALLKSYNPELTAKQIKEAIVAGVDKIDALEEYCSSGGRVNAFKAFQQVHNHTYGDYTSIDIHSHSRTCSTCGYVETKSHGWFTNPAGGWRCPLCGMTTLIKPVINPGYLSIGGEMYVVDGEWCCKLSDLVLINGQYYMRAENTLATQEVEHLLT